MFQTLCITDDDNVWSWGDGDYGKLGRGGSDGCKIPMKVDSLAGLGKKKFPHQVKWEKLDRDKNFSGRAGSKFEVFGSAFGFSHFLRSGKTFTKCGSGQNPTQAYL